MSSQVSPLYIIKGKIRIPPKIFEAPVEQPHSSYDLFRNMVAYELFAKHTDASNYVVSTLTYKLVVFKASSATKFNLSNLEPNLSQRFQESCGQKMTFNELCKSMEGIFTIDYKRDGALWTILDKKLPAP